MKMMKRLWGLLLLGLLAGTLPGQTAVYCVYLTDRPACGPEVREDFESKAIERRLRHGLAFPAADDCPLDHAYVSGVAAEVEDLRYSLRWLNAVTVSATAEQVDALSDLPYVARVEPLFGELLVTSLPVPLPVDSAMAVDLCAHQRGLMFLDTLAAHGLDGSGIRIAVLDAGFKGLEGHPGLQHLKVVASHDFYGNDANALHHSEHGTAVVGCIGGRFRDRPIGAAPGAELLLARTEHNWLEKPIEEDHWLAAMEWADRNGADIISSSLGYAGKRYTYADMDGHTAPVTRAAQIAVRKGMLVVVSAGNEGDGKFRYLSAPADADSVLAVGASYPMVRLPMGFSSWGPNARKVPKPDVSAPGYTLSTNKKGDYGVFPGTSFACPLVAGYAACLMQLHPEATNMEIFDMVKAQGHLYPFFDYRLGTGVPDARWAFNDRPEVAPTLEVRREADSLHISVDTAGVARDRVARTNGTPLHVRRIHPDGYLTYSVTARMPWDHTGVVLALPRDDARGTIEIWYRGYIWREE